MAYVSEQIITKARTALKALNKEYGVKATISGKGSTDMCLTISEGKIDFIGNFCENTKTNRRMHDTQQVIDWVHLESSFSGIALEYLDKAKAIMYADHWDKSDIQSDYFNCSFFVNINIGRWNKPYKLVK